MSAEQEPRKANETVIKYYLKIVSVHHVEEWTSTVLHI